MKKILIYLFFVFIILLIACSGNNSSETKNPATEVKDIVDSNKNDDEIFNKEIIGTWSSFETVRGETIVFEKNGKYSGYDGREKYAGNWVIKGHRIELNSGLFFLDIKVDTLYLDSVKYMRQAPALTDKNE